jgi:hypothetical protein
MPSKNQRPLSHAIALETTKAVDGFMQTLEHPSKKVIQAIRAAVLAADRSIAEGVKWNAPSFRTTEYFATINLREKKGVGIILHLGAKTRDLPLEPEGINDPARLLKWLGEDRAMILFENLEDFNTKKTAFEQIIQQWITHV